MAVRSTVDIRIAKTGLQDGGTVTCAPATVENATAPESGKYPQDFTANTFAAVSIPSGKNGVFIQIPSSNAGTVTQKGVTGDTGNVILTTGGLGWWQPLGTGAVLGFLCSTSISLTFTWT